MLRRVDPEHGMARFYARMIERDLFGTVRLVRNRGQIGIHGRELVDVFETEKQAAEVLEVQSDTGSKQGYAQSAYPRPTT
jgi:predicted DNA-binding WGR domain protein